MIASKRRFARELTRRAACLDRVERVARRRSRQTEVAGLLLGPMNLVVATMARLASRELRRRAGGYA